ncbi:MAG: PTS transporter subunit EIIB [Treponema sp.]|nr:PTS transporter subunit EIIB [Treponema sp.]
MGWNEKVCASFYELCGGRQNVTDLTVCFTRLRIKLADANLIDKDAMTALPFVRGLITVGQEYHLVIGMQAAVIFNDLQNAGKVLA